MTADPVRVNYTVQGSFTIDRAVWNRMTPDQREQRVEGRYRTALGVQAPCWTVTNADLNDPTED